MEVEIHLKATGDHISLIYPAHADTADIKLLKGDDVGPATRDHLGDASQERAADRCRGDDERCR